MIYDYAIIGAGSAGAVIAARLSEDSAATVALIEAGPDYPDFELLPAELKYGHATAAYVTTHSHLWGYVATATRTQKPRPLPRGKVVGGTSAINGQVFLRGLEQDFADWAALGNPEWSFAKVLPFFRALERDVDFDNEWHGRTGPVPVRRYHGDELLPAQTAFYEAALNMGYPACPDANQPGARGVGPIPFNNLGGIRASTAVAYLADSRHRANLTIIADTTVYRLRLEGSTITGIEASGPEGDVLIEARQYVLSAGVVGSPHLLMLSGIGDPAMLRAAGVEPALALSGVGARYADHQVVDLVWDVDPETAPAGAEVPKVQMALRYTAAGSPNSDDMQITVRTAAPGKQNEPLVSLVPGIELPEATGQVTITSADPHIQPDINLRFLDNAADLARLRESVRICLDIADDPAMRTLLHRRVTPVESALASDAAIDAWLLETVRTSHHGGGTCAMGRAGDPDSVVDQYARVHGVDNLRVADASIMPQLVRANTNATTMMIGERVAAFMKEDHR